MSVKSNLMYQLSVWLHRKKWYTCSEYRYCNLQKEYCRITMKVKWIMDIKFCLLICDFYACIKYKFTNYIIRISFYILHTTYDHIGHQLIYPAVIYQWYHTMRCCNNNVLTYIGTLVCVVQGRNGSPSNRRWYIHNSSYHHHHQIESINLAHCCHFPWLCAWGGCTIECCSFHIYPGKSRVVFLFYWFDWLIDFTCLLGHLWPST